MNRAPGLMLLLAGWLLNFCFVPCEAADTTNKTLLILVQGPDGHPPQSHEFVAGGEILKMLLQPVPELKVEVRHVEQEAKVGDDKLDADIAAADGVALYLAEGAKWIGNDERKQQAFAKLAERGGGMFALHWSIGTKEAKHIELFVTLFGACHGGPDRKYKVLETTVTPAKHAITSGIEAFKIRDEFYYQLKTNPQHEKLLPLLTAEIEKKPHMVAWGWDRPDGGRSAGFSGGHFHANWKRSEYQRFIAQSILWTVKIDPPQENFPPEITEEAFILPQ